MGESPVTEGEHAISSTARVLLGFAAVCTGFVSGSFSQVALRDLEKMRRQRCARFCRTAESAILT